MLLTKADIRKVPIYFPLQCYCLSDSDLATQTLRTILSQKNEILLLNWYFCSAVRGIMHSLTAIEVVTQASLQLATRFRDELEPVERKQRVYSMPPCIEVRSHLRLE